MNTTPFDTYRDAFYKFLSEGMTHAEAIEQFDKDAIHSAILAEFERGDSVQYLNPETCLVENACGHETFFDLVIRAQCERRNLRDFEEQAVPLMLAGWTSEQPNPTNSKDFWLQCQVMSLYWRAPSKRPGKPGRRYLSTNQAFNAMKKAEAAK